MAGHVDLPPSVPELVELCKVLSENLGAARAVSHALEQRAYLSQLADAAGEAATAEPEPTHLLCLGGVGVAAVAARRHLSARQRGPARPRTARSPVAAQVTAVLPVFDQRAAWRMLLARMVAFANGFTDIHCAMHVPARSWDVLLVEGLDIHAIADGVLMSLREAAAYATPYARVVPSLARIRAILCSTCDFSSVADDQFDFRVVCGHRQTAVVAPLLCLDEDSALAQGYADLSAPFDALTLWQTSPSPRQGEVAAALASIHAEESKELRVTCTASGECTAIFFWWETADPLCVSGLRAVAWLPTPCSVRAGEAVTVRATRSLTRIHFVLPDGSARASRDSSRPGERRSTEEGLAALRHAPMLADDARNGAYRGALARGVRRARELHGKASVLEIGSGTGVLIMMAKRLGAERVLGCEVDPCLCQLAAQVAADNGMPLGEDSFDLAQADFLALLRDPGLQGGQFNLLVAELMDNSGLGEQLWPFFALAQKYLLALDPPPVILPRRLTIFAALVSVEIAPLGETTLWPLDPFWYCSSIPNMDSVGRRTRRMALDLDRHGLHWEVASDVVEVLTVDLTGMSLESVRPQEMEVAFTSCRDGPINGVVWFWHADLDEECCLTTVPAKLWDACGHSLPSGVVRGSRQCWKQAIQVLGPVWVGQGQAIPARAHHDTTSLRWELTESCDPARARSMPSTNMLLRWLEEERRVTADLVLEVSEVVQAWLRSVASEDRLQQRVVESCKQGRLLVDSHLKDPAALCEQLHEAGCHLAVMNRLLPLLYGGLTSGAACPT